MAAPTRADLVAYGRRAAQQNGVDPDVFERLIQQESGWNPTARNASSGAEGLGQLMPQFYGNVDRFDPYANLDAAAQTLGANLQHYRGDYTKAVAAYNAGVGAVDRYGGVPPYAETQTYVNNILGGQMATTKAPLQEGGTYTPGDQGAAGTTTSGTPMGPQENAYSADRWKQIVASHRGITGAVPTKYITQRDLKNNVTRTPDLSAPLKFSFGDGTWASATITPTGAANIADVGTALKATPPARASAAPRIVSDAAGNKYEEGADGTLTPALPAGDTSSTLSAPDSQEFIPQITRHPDGTYAVDWIKNQNYRAPATTATGMPLAEALQRSTLLSEQLARDVESGRLGLDQAAQTFNEWHTLNVTDPIARLNAQTSVGNLAESAAARAQQTALGSLAYRVGPNFGADFARGNQTLSGGGGKVAYDPGDFTFDMPDFGAIGQQAATQALTRVGIDVHPADRALAAISPTAAANVGAPPPNTAAIPGIAAAVPYTPPGGAPAEAAPTPVAPYVPRPGGVTGPM